MMSKPSSEICSARGGAGVAACGRATSPTGGQHGLALADLRSTLVQKRTAG